MADSKTMGGEHPIAAVKRLAHWDVSDGIGMLRIRLACVSAQADKLLEARALDAQLVADIDAVLDAAWLDIGEWRRLARAQRAASTDPNHAPLMPSQAGIEKSTLVMERIGAITKRLGEWSATAAAKDPACR